MTSLALIKDDRYLEHNAGDHHPESPNRLRVIHELIAKEFSAVPLIEPRLATTDELAAIHDPLYIQAIAETEGIPFSRLDADTGLSARTWEVARLAAGGLLNAVDVLLAPDASRLPASSVFAFIRPPGHHAEPHRGMGFCIFNNVAVAAEYAIRKHSLKRILIVDWDLHHGNGTQRAFYGRSDVLYFSSHQFPHYPGTGDYDEIGSGNGKGFTVNAPFPAGFGDAEYLEVYSRILRPIALSYRPELVIVSAGFDPYVKDPLGGMEVTGDGFGKLMSLIRGIAEETCGGKVLVALEGGYNPDGLREGVRAVLQSLIGPRQDVQPIDAPKAERVIQTIISHQMKHWNGLM